MHALQSCRRNSISGIKLWTNHPFSVKLPVFGFGGFGKRWISGLPRVWAGSIFSHGYATNLTYDWFALTCTIFFLGLVTGPHLFSHFYTLFTFFTWARHAHICEVCRGRFREQEAGSLLAFNVRGASKHQNGVPNQLGLLLSLFGR